MNVAQLHGQQWPHHVSSGRYRAHEVEQEAWSSGSQSQAPDGALALAVARLLAIAVKVSASEDKLVASSLPIPEEYTQWPSLEVAMEGCEEPLAEGRAQRFFVNPKALRAPEHEFPIGTTFVVETRHRGGARRRPGRRSTVNRAVTRLVLTKCGNVDRPYSTARSSDLWLCVEDGWAGDRRAARLCHVCRLPAS